MAWKQRAEHGLLELIELPEHFVRLYANRLAVWRQDGERLTWEELQLVKTEVWGDRVAIEVFPAENRVVNLRHTRHLWSSEAIEKAVQETCQHPEFELASTKDTNDNCRRRNNDK